MSTTNPKKPPRVSLKSVTKEFDQAKREALVLHDLGKALNEPDLPEEVENLGFSRSKGNLITAQGFLRLMGAWEQFVEGVFLRFLVGATTDTNVPTLTVDRVSTLDLAFAALLGEPGRGRRDHYLSWTQWRTVTKRAKQHMAGGEPFTSVMNPGGRDARWYNLALTVRNRIAHPSDNARHKFIVAARAYLGVDRLRRGYMAGELLIAPANKSLFVREHHGKTTFEAVAASMTNLAGRLTA